MARDMAGCSAKQILVRTTMTNDAPAFWVTISSCRFYCKGSGQKAYAKGIQSTTYMYPYTRANFSTIV